MLSACCARIPSSPSPQSLALPSASVPIPPFSLSSAEDSTSAVNQLGIGANTAVFSVHNRLLLSNLAVERPAELYQLTYRNSLDTELKPGDYIASFPYPFLQELQSNSRTITAASCSASSSPSFRSGNESRILGVELVCGNLFDVLGIKAKLGRMLNSADNLKPGEHPVVVLAHHFWQSEFNSDPSIVGRSITLNRSNFTVIGVAPANYLSMSKGNAPAMWVPIVMDGILNGEQSITPNRSFWWIRILLRQKQGTAPQVMEAELTSMLQGYRESADQVPSEYQKKLADSLRVQVLPAGRGYDQGNREKQFGQSFNMLLAVAGAVLLIACINIANLLLARASARQREIATRLAIGASRARLIRQFMTESLALAACGGTLGLLLAVALERIFTLEAFGTTALIAVPQFPSTTVLLVCLGLTLLSGLGFGLAPALTADSQGLQPSHRFNGRKLLVSLQVALSVLLLSSAGLFLMTLDNLRSIDAGFHREHLISMTVNPTLAGRTEASSLSYYQQTEEQVRQIPGIQHATFSAIGLLSGGMWSSDIQIVGITIPEGAPTPLINAVGPGFFNMIGATLLSGRDFTLADNSNTSPKVAIINESFARKYFGETPAIGRKIGCGRRDGHSDLPDFTIIAVVKDLRDYRINETGRPYWYVPYARQERLASLTLIARTYGDPKPMLGPIRAAISHLDPLVPISRETTLTMAVEAQIVQERIVAQLSAFFAAIAVLLAVIGLYGVMSYTVERRTKEIGIRIALGEARSQVFSKILTEALTFIAIGIAAGIPMSLALAAYAEKLLYGVKPADWLPLCIAILIVGSFGLLASYITAHRAAGIDPMAALRIE